MPIVQFNNSCINKLLDINKKFLFELIKRLPELLQCINISKKRAAKRLPKLVNWLFEVLNSAFKDLLIFFKRYIFIEVFALAFAVAHLAEYSAVGRGDTLDCTD